VYSNGGDVVMKHNVVHQGVTKYNVVRQSKPALRNTHPPKGGKGHTVDDERLTKTVDGDGVPNLLP
jgi:hypothetical protein